MGNRGVSMEQMRRVFDKGFYLSYVGDMNKKLNDKVEKNLRIVSEIDQKILDLVHERNSILWSINSQCIAHQNDRVCIGASPRKVWGEYKKDGFKSEYVKNAVGNIRSLFFDDGQAKF